MTSSRPVGGGRGQGVAALSIEPGGPAAHFERTAAAKAVPLARSSPG